MSSRNRLRELYRSLHREIRAQATDESAKAYFLGHLKRQFKDPNLPVSTKAVRDAEDALLFLSSQRTYNELLQRYNPGLSGLEASDNIEKTARRVGLHLPGNHKP